MDSSKPSTPSASASNNIVYEMALAYARSGIYVHPVKVSRRPDGKKNVQPGGRWREKSSISPADVAAWWLENPDLGILIDCGKSGLVVVDCDGEEGIANWEALGAEDTPATVLTAGGGQHRYYRAHPDHVIGNDQDGKVASHVDIRGLGGFVIAPPTSDGQGSWIWVEWPWGELPIVPAIVVERMTRPAPARQEPAPSVQEVDEAFDSASRQFTEQQAIAFIKAEMEKLKATKRGFNGAINNFAMACAHFPWLVDRARCGRLMIKALGPITGWTAPDADDERTIESAYAATEGGRSWVAEKVPDSTSTPPHDPSRAESSDRVILPPPGQPLAVARELADRLPATDGERHLAWWRGDFYRWAGAHWEVEEVTDIEHWLYAETGDAIWLAPAKKEGEPPVEMPWAPTRKKVGDLAHALGVGELHRGGEEDRVLAAANGVIEQSSAGVPRRRQLLPHRPGRFNLFSLPFDYDPAASAPGWRAFLDQVLPDDQEAQDFLGEWFGYVLSGRTDQQKMAALIGKKRSGKGTIARVLGALVGKESVAGLNLGLLGGTFGLEPFVGAALAVASDVRWHSRNIGDAVQILLEVTGEDQVTVHRKNKTAWKGRLGVRFMLMSNDTPTFSDRSGALVDRMLYVSFRQSFFGREDVGLTDRLMGELPGILNWALDGLDRLDNRGRFTQPKSGEAEAESTRRLADPIGSFIEDWCVIEPGQRISLDHLFLKYQNWCESEGRFRDTTTKEIFSRDLRAKVDGLSSTRARDDSGKYVTTLRGIGCSVM